MLSRRFAALAANWHQLARREVILGLFSRPYFQTVLTIPMFLALPAYLAGRLSFGGLMQIRSAFQNVVTTLSWFIFSYKDLAQLAATASRLRHFLAAAEAAPSDGMAGPRIAEGTAFRTHRLRLSTPEGRPLALLPELEIGAGDCCWIVAPSGFGKSTLVKALAGLWRHGEGAIERPTGPVAFASQQVYLPLGSLEAALAYPALPEAFSVAQYRHSGQPTSRPGSASARGSQAGSASGWPWRGCICTGRTGSSWTRRPRRWMPSRSARCWRGCGRRCPRRPSSSSRIGHRKGSAPAGRCGSPTMEGPMPRLSRRLRSLP